MESVTDLIRAASESIADGRLDDAVSDLQDAAKLLDPSTQDAMTVDLAQLAVIRCRSMLAEAMRRLYLVSRGEDAR